VFFFLKAQPGMIRSGQFQVLFYCFQNKSFVYFNVNSSMRLAISTTSTYSHC